MTALEYLKQEMNEFMQSKYGQTVSAQLMADIQSQASKVLKNYKMLYIGADQDMKVFAGHTDGRIFLTIQ